MEQTAAELLGVGGNLHTPADLKGQKTRVQCEPKRRHRGRKERHEVADSVSSTLAQRSIDQERKNLRAHVRQESRGDVTRRQELQAN